MKCYEKEINGKIERFRLTSKESIAIEEEVQMPLINYVQIESVKTCVKLLQHMKRFENPDYSLENAQDLYDSLIDTGMTYKQIFQDIIIETLVASGFLSEEEWQKTKKEIEEMKLKMETKKQNILKNI
jgi:hypothetical protein